MNEKLIFDNIPLIYKVIKDMRCYWKTEDEFQSLYDAGLEGLIRGSKSYNDTKGKPSTFLYKCIKNQICKEIILSEMDKRKINKETMISLDNEVKPENDTTYKDLIEDPNVNIEEEIEKKLLIERIAFIANKVLNKTDNFVIREFYGLNDGSMHSIEDISKKIGVSIKMIYFRKKRAIRKIKENINKDDREAFIIENVSNNKF